MKCDQCEGTGRVDVLYCEMHGVSCSYEAAADLAGRVHHQEECEECNGTGEIEEEGE